MYQSVNLYEAKTQLSGLVERDSPNLPLSAHFSSINAGWRIRIWRRKRKALTAKFAYMAED